MVDFVFERKRRQSRITLVRGIPHPSFVSFSEPPEIVPFSFGKPQVNEGDFAQLTCSVSRGDQPLKITWSLKGDVISSEPTLTTTMIGTRTSILIINSVGYRHSGLFTCRATNKAGSVSYSTDLKVNGTI